MKKAKSIADISRLRFKLLPFTGRWKDSLGTPECSGSWIIWGNSGNGKTRFALELAAYLSNFEKVFYNSLEEGLRLSFQRAVLSYTFKAGNFAAESEDMQAMRIRLDKKRSPRVIIIDSVQFSHLTVKGYKKLLNDYPRKLFIFISHANGLLPKGAVADAIRYQSDIKIHIDKFIAFPASRYGGTEPFTIWDEGAQKAWGPHTQKINL